MVKLSILNQVLVVECTRTSQVPDPLATIAIMGNLATQELNAWGSEFFEQSCFKVKQVVECKFDFL